MSVILFNMSNAYSRGDSNSMVECCATAPDAFVAVAVDVAVAVAAQNKVLLVMLVLCDSYYTTLHLSLVCLVWMGIFLTT